MGKVAERSRASRLAKIFVPGGDEGMVEGTIREPIRADGRLGIDDFCDRAKPGRGRNASGSVSRTIRKVDMVGPLSVEFLCLSLKGVSLPIVLVLPSPFGN
jgi:hypothetical protein